MKQIVFLSLTLLLTSFLLTPKAFAVVSVNVSGNADNAESHVNVQSNTTGQRTVCVNGECTTTGGENKSTVCVNGKCYDSTEGNVNVETPDGTTKVHINSNTGNNSTDAPSVAPTGEVKGIATDAAKPNRMKAIEKRMVMRQQARERHFDIGGILRGIQHAFMSWMF